MNHMNPHLWYDRQGQPIDTAKANTLLGDPAYKRVGLTDIASASNPDTNYRVSTVWLGVDHSFGDGPPIMPRRSRSSPPRCPTRPLPTSTTGPRPPDPANA
jgi:hypothetical protein